MGYPTRDRDGMDASYNPRPSMDAEEIASLRAQLASALAQVKDLQKELQDFEADDAGEKRCEELEAQVDALKGGKPPELTAVMESLWSAARDWTERGSVGDDHPWGGGVEKRVIIDDHISRAQHATAAPLPADHVVVRREDWERMKAAIAQIKAAQTPEAIAKRIDGYVADHALRASQPKGGEG